MERGSRIKPVPPSHRPMIRGWEMGRISNKTSQTKEKKKHKCLEYWKPSKSVSDRRSDQIQSNAASELYN